MIYENCNEIKLKRRLIVMRVLEGKLVDNGTRVGIVAARFNEFIVSKLVAGAHVTYSAWMKQTWK